MNFLLIAHERVREFCRMDGMMRWIALVSVSLGMSSAERSLCKLPHSRCCFSAIAMIAFAESLILLKIDGSHRRRACLVLADWEIDAAFG